MKFSKFLMLAGLTAFMASCSSDEPLVADDFDPISPEMAKGETYALFNLAMPEQPGTRTAVQPDKGNDGLPQEYKISNGRILIFEKANSTVTDEADYTYVDNAVITVNPGKDNADDIDRSAYVYVKFAPNFFDTADTNGKEYYGLVVLNVTSDFPFPEDKQKFGVWKQIATDKVFQIGADNANDPTKATFLTMISAPRYDTTSTSTVTKTTTLVRIPGSGIVTDVNKLNKNTPAATFFVHRIAAKITFDAPGNVTGKANTYKIAGGTYAGSEVLIEEWNADVIAKECYPVQNVAGLNLFPSHMHTTPGSGNPFPTFARCNWAVSPQYSTNYNKDKFTTVEETDLIDLAANPDHVIYVKENTMEAQKQQQHRTTRVVIGATFKYKADATSEPAAVSLFKVKGPDSYELLTNEVLQNRIKNKAALVIQNGTTSKDIDVVSKITGATEGGYISLSDYCTITWGDDKTVATNTQMDEIAKELGLESRTSEDLAYYKGGKCYYKAIIRHFADDDVSDTELVNGKKYVVLDKTEEINTADSYDEVRHLGRYGLLRNNWYDLKISAVGKIGEPEIPEAGPEPDDEDERYQAIDFSVRILSWAKRSQSVTL